MKNILQKNRSLIAFTFIFILGLIARFNHLTKSNLWYDEAFSGILVRLDFNNLINIIIQDRVHPPLYYIFLKGWVDILGNSQESIKAFSIIFGMLLLVAAFVLLKKVFNTNDALIASFLFALSPFFILYSLEARSYMMLAFEVLLAVFVFIKIYNSNAKSLIEIIRLRYFKYLILLFAVMILTHYLCLPLIVAMCALLFTKVFPWSTKIIWAGLVILLLLVLAKGFLNNGNYRIIAKEGTHTSWLSDATPIQTGEVLHSFLFGVQSQTLGNQPGFVFSFLQDMNLISILTLGLVILFATFSSLKGDSKLKAISKLFLINLIIVSIASIAGVNIFLPRYLISLGVVFIVWISVLIATLSFKKILLVMAIFVALLTQVIWKDTSREFNITEINAKILENRVLVNSPFDYLVLNYYLNGNKNLFLYDPESNMINNPWAFYTREQIVTEKVEGDFMI